MPRHSPAQYVRLCRRQEWAILFLLSYLSRARTHAIPLNPPPFPGPWPITSPTPLHDCTMSQENAIQHREPTRLVTDRLIPAKGQWKYKFPKDCKELRLLVKFEHKKGKWKPFRDELYVHKPTWWCTTQFTATVSNPTIVKVLCLCGSMLVRLKQRGTHRRQHGRFMVGVTRAEPSPIPFPPPPPFYFNV